MNTLITEYGEHGEETLIDIYTKLASDRILFLDDYLDDKLATDLAATLLLKDCEEKELITLMINCEGADTRSCFLLYDMMQLISSPIKTICVGAAMNSVVLILAAGTKGLRYATPNAVICAGQLVKEEYQRATLMDAKSIVSRIEKDNKSFLTALAKHTDKKMTDLRVELKEKVFMNSTRAKKFGILDGIVGSK